MRYDPYEELDADGSYDVMQVCLNGHQITTSLISYPQHGRAYCKDCGSPTISACPDCNANMRGYLRGSMSLSDIPVPNYCEDCGRPFPWHEAAIENMKDILRQEDLADDQLAIFDAALPDVLRDTPKTESSAMRVRKVLQGLGKPAYAVMVRVLSDVASESAKKSLGF